MSSDPFSPEMVNENNMEGLDIENDEEDSNHTCSCKQAEQQNRKNNKDECIGILIRQLSKLQTRLEKAEDEVENLKTQLDDALFENTEMRTYLEDAQLENERLRDEMADHEHRNSGLKGNLNDVKVDIHELQTDLEICNLQNTELSIKLDNTEQRVLELEDRNKASNSALKNARTQIRKLEHQKAYTQMALAKSTAKNKQLKTQLTDLTDEYSRLDLIRKDHKLDAAVCRALYILGEAELGVLKVAMNHGVSDRERMVEARAEVELARDKLLEAETAMREFEKEHGIDR